MMKKINTVIISCILSTLLLAEDSTKEKYVGDNRDKANNEVDSKELFLKHINTGWGMYYEGSDEQEQLKKELEKGSATDKTIVMLLSEILDTNKENLKTNKEILKVLQGEFDPQPKKMVVDGKECFENDSARCYKMPAFTPEAKMPIYVNFHQNPSIQTAAEVIKWEDKHFWEIRKSAHLRQQALAQFSDEIRPYNGTNRTGYRDGRGEYEKVHEAAVLKTLLKLSSKYRYDFYFGENDGENLHQVTVALKLIRTFEEYGELPVRFVFNSNKSASTIKEVMNTLDRKAFDAKNPIEFAVLPKAEYKKLNIKVTPSFGVLDKKKKTFQVLTAGQTTVTKMINSIKAFMMVKDEFKDSMVSDFKVIKESGDFMMKKVEKQFNLTDIEKAQFKKVMK
ncbi:MAG: hypothetical protein KKE17_15795 [Proteobacteria bacterium]|nr:hypothetical protein [Pseudomonadota bacterium]MBU1901888.1 hypothetical protein [Patescibacteria group bacterium]